MSVTHSSLSTLPERDQLITDHLEYVRGLAAKVKKEISSRVDFEELVAYGQRGLVEAAQRFDATRGVSFTTFSYYRIRGAIYDGLRESGWLSRHEIARFHAQANSLLENLADRAADTEQNLTETASTLDQLATIFIVSLDASEQIEPQSSDEQDASALLEEHQTRHAVHDAISQLPEKERRLLEMCYQDELSIKEAGERLGLSKSWASRLHARAIQLLTELLGPSF